MVITFKPNLEEFYLPESMNVLNVLEETQVTASYWQVAIESLEKFEEELKDFFDTNDLSGILTIIDCMEEESSSFQDILSAFNELCTPRQVIRI